MHFCFHSGFTQSLCCPSKKDRRLHLNQLHLLIMKTVQQQDVANHKLYTNSNFSRHACVSQTVNSNHTLALIHVFCSLSAPQEIQIFFFGFILPEISSFSNSFSLVRIQEKKFNRIKMYGFFFFNMIVDASSIPRNLSPSAVLNRI